MKYSIRGCIRSVFAVALLFVMAFCVAGCDFPSQGEGGGGQGSQDDLTAHPIEADDFLTAEGEFLKNRRGETVYLRGINAGGLFVTENWMNGFETVGPTEEIDIRARDFKTLSKVFIERFGLEKTEELWRTYQENWWSEIDFENCARMGMNCIRLPFTYMTVDFDAVVDYDNAGDFDFTPLDSFIDKAAAYGMYTILDLHGAYGSQNGQDHSGETIDSASQVTFYSNSRLIDLTAKLWSAIAERYRDDPAVAGYDLLNEPGEKAASTEEKHFSAFNTLYRAVREKDKEHVVIFESCWEGRDLPDPNVYGWKNCMYSFHHYTNLSGGNAYTQHGVSFNDKLAEISRQHFGVPLFMGEFNNYNDPAQWEYVLDLLNRLGWHWTSWTYKINNTWANSAWGVYAVPAEDKVNAHLDSYETILQKFTALKTTEDIYRTDLDGQTLESIMHTYLTAPVQTPLPAGTYTLYDTITLLPLCFENGLPALAPDRNGGLQFRIISHPDGDGSVYISSNAGGYLTVSGNAVRAGTASVNARFYPVETEFGYAFISYVTCRYLRFDENNRLYADGTILDESAIFNCE